MQQETTEEKFLRLLYATENKELIDAYGAFNLEMRLQLAEIKAQIFGSRKELDEIKKIIER